MDTRSDNPHETVKSLQILVKIKDEIINQNELDKNYLDNKMKNLEKLLIEKDKCISRLTKHVDELASINASHPDLPVAKKNPPPKDPKNNLNEDKNAQPNNKREKCKYEDRGKCKLGKKCNNFHPKGVCKSYGETNSCQNPVKCVYRHPTKACFEWQKGSKCQWKENCHFNHPTQQGKKSDFLGQQHRKTQNQILGPQMSPWSNPSPLPTQLPDNHLLKPVYNAWPQQQQDQTPQEQHPLPPFPFLQTLPQIPQFKWGYQFQGQPFNQ